MHVFDVSNMKINQVSTNFSEMCIRKCLGVVAFLLCSAMAVSTSLMGSVFPTYLPWSMTWALFSWGCRLGKLLVGAWKKTHLRRPTATVKKLEHFRHKSGENKEYLKPQTRIIYTYIYWYWGSHLQPSATLFFVWFDSKTYPMTGPMKLVDLPTWIGSFFWGKCR